MYRFKTLGVFFLLLALGIFSITRVFRVTDRKMLAYEKTLNYTKPCQKERKGVTHRKQVIKNLWVKKKDALHQYIVISEGSTLHLNQIRSKETKMSESMQEATCLLQQKIFFVDDKGTEIKDPSSFSGPVYPKQQICKLKVHDGSYNYYTKVFSGSQVGVTLYEVSTHEFHADIALESGKVMMNGQCDTIYFSMHEDSPNLELKDLVATVYE